MRRRKTERLDLGDDHYAEPLYVEGVQVGYLIGHRKRDGSECWGGIYLDTPEARAKLGTGTRAFWQVESRDPLTLSPSILCLDDACQDHGFIREGRWVRA